MRAAFEDGVVDLYQRLKQDMTAAEFKFMSNAAPLRTARSQPSGTHAGAE